METKQCKRCGVVQGSECFYTRGVGLSSWCKKCHRDYSKAHERGALSKKARLPESVLRDLRRQKVKAKWHEFFTTHPCVDCGEARPACLMVEHVRGTKEFEFRNRNTGPWSSIVRELHKYDVRCFNCMGVKNYVVPPVID